MQRRSTVQQHGMFANHVFQNVPDHRFLRFDQFLGLLDGGAVARSFELVIDERLEQFERHLLRQTALVQLQLRSDDDDRASRVVDALAEQVLTETALLALERIGQRLERAVVGAAQYASATAIVEQSVDGFLEHALLVANDYVRGVQFHQLLQPVVAVDDAAIQVVQIGSGKTATVQRHQRAQFRRKHGNHIQNHPFRLVAALAERFKNLQPLGEFDSLLQAGVDLHLFAQLFGKLVHFHATQQFLDGFGAHAGRELAEVFLLQFAELIFGNDVLFLELHDFAWVDADEGLEVQNVLEVAHGDVQQIADAAGQSLEEPHVRAGRSQLDVAQAFTADLAQSDFDAALIADHSAMLHALVFSAQTFPVGDGAENLGAEQSVTFRLEGAVINGLRLGYFAVGPGPNLFWTRQADANGIKIRDLAGTIIWARTVQGLILLSWQRQD